jgi:hypothetical protein
MRPATAILLAAWVLTAGTSTNKSGRPDNAFPTEAACVAEAKRRVEIGKRAKAKAEAEAAALERAHPEAGKPTLLMDFDVTWECREMKPGGRVVTGP